MSAAQYYTCCTLTTWEYWDISTFHVFAISKLDMKRVEDCGSAYLPTHSKKLDLYLWCASDIRHPFYLIHSLPTDKPGRDNMCGGEQYTYVMTCSQSMISIRVPWADTVHTNLNIYLSRYISWMVYLYV